MSLQSEAQNNASCPVLCESGSLLGSFFPAPEVCLGIHLVPMEISENSVPLPPNRAGTDSLSATSDILA